MVAEFRRDVHVGELCAICGANEIQHADQEILIVHARKPDRHGAHKDPDAEMLSTIPSDHKKEQNDPLRGLVALEKIGQDKFHTLDKAKIRLGDSLANWTTSLMRRIVRLG